MKLRVSEDGLVMSILERLAGALIWLLDHTIDRPKDLNKWMGWS